MHIMHDSLLSAKIALHPAIKSNNETHYKKRLKQLYTMLARFMDLQARLHVQSAWTAPKKSSFLKCTPSGKQIFTRHKLMSRLLYKDLLTSF